MKNLVAAFLLLLFVSTCCFSKPHLSKPASIDEYYDKYKSNVSWGEQRSRLDNFAIALLSEPEGIGYIAFQSNKKEPLKKAKARISRTVQYLTILRRIEKSRIVVIYTGEKEEPEIILQIVIRGRKPPFKAVAG